MAEAEADADDSHYSISQISILWYNTYSLPILTTRYHIQAIVDYIGACMTKHKVNVIGLCEVWLSRDAEFMSKYILEMLGPDWTVYISSKNKLVGDGIILFWNKSEVHIGTLFSTKYGLSCGLDSLVSKGFISTLITPYKVIDNKRVLSSPSSRLAARTASRPPRAVHRPRPTGIAGSRPSAIPARSFPARSRRLLAASRPRASVSRAAAIPSNPSTVRTMRRARRRLRRAVAVERARRDRRARLLPPRALARRAFAAFVRDESRAREWRPRSNAIGRWIAVARAKVVRS